MMSDKQLEVQEESNKEIGSQESKQGYYFDKTNHVHLLNGKPLIGTSSMASVLSKPLTWWAAGLACNKYGWVHPGDARKGWTPMDVRLQKMTEFLSYTKDYSVEDWIKLGDEAYRAHSVKLKDSAEEGTDMHAVMEEYVNYCLKTNDGKPCPDYSTAFVNVSDVNKKKLDILIEWSTRRVKRFLASEINCYSEKLWLGGIVDVVFEDVDGKFAILDFKSSKEVYLSQFWQCIGYKIQLEENGGYSPEGIKLLDLKNKIDYVCVLPFGMTNPSVQYYTDMDGGIEAVKSMCVLYKMLNK